MLTSLQHLIKIPVVLHCRSLEESQGMAARHQAELNAMRAHCASLQQQIQQQQKEYDDLTQQMRQLVEAQWNAVNRFPVPVGKRNVITCLKRLSILRS